MSTAAAPQAHLDLTHEHEIGRFLRPAPGYSPAAAFAAGAVPPRRRGSPAQGRSLESLGHAVEYLVDSRLFQMDDQGQRDEAEAVQILMRLSRAVFAECPEVVSIHERLRRWLQHFAPGQPTHTQGTGTSA